MKYAKYFHEKRDTEGHVFQDRPGMKIVLKESYLRDLTGYIHRNPVEAGIVEKVQGYEWSSWKWFLSGEIEDIKSGLFPPGFEEDSRKSFDEVIESDFDLPEGEYYWGTQEEWEQLEKRREGREGRKFRERRDRRPMDEIVDQFVEDSDYTKEELKSQSRRRELSNVRQKAMKELYQVGYTPSEIGPYFNRTPAAVNYALRQQNEE